MKESTRQAFRQWLRAKPGNVKRAPLREQMRQFVNAQLKAKGL